MEQKKFVMRKDFIIIGGILLLAALLYIGIIAMRPKGPRLYAEIYYGNQVAEKVYLDEEKEFSIEQAPAIRFAVKDGAIAFVESNCPDQVCVHTGYLNYHGGFAACLPNGVGLFISEE